MENEKRFSYLPSFSKAQDELRENVDRLQETLKITKNKTEENFNNAPSVVEQSQERRFQPRNPYLQQVISRNLFNTESYQEHSTMPTRSQSQSGGTVSSRVNGYRSVLDKF